MECEYRGVTESVLLHSHLIEKDDTFHFNSLKISAMGGAGGYSLVPLSCAVCSMAEHHTPVAPFSIANAPPYMSVVWVAQIAALSLLRACPTFDFLCSTVRNRRTGLLWLQRKYQRREHVRILTLSDASTNMGCPHHMTREEVDTFEKPGAMLV